MMLSRRRPDAADACDALTRAYPCEISCARARARSDVLLNIRLVGKRAVEAGVSEHVCELQVPVSSGWCKRCELH